MVRQLPLALAASCVPCLLDLLQLLSVLSVLEGCTAGLGWLEHWPDLIPSMVTLQVGRPTKPARQLRSCVRAAAVNFASFACTNKLISPLPEQRLTSDSGGLHRGLKRHADGQQKLQPHSNSQAECTSDVNLRLAAVWQLHR